MALISIIVVTCNSIARIESCLASVLAQKSQNFDLIVIDNASTDGTREVLKSRFSRLKLIENPVNYGYAKALNQGIAVSGGEFILCLNDDAILKNENFLTTVSEGMDKDKHCGSIQPKLLNPDGTIDTTGIYLSFLRRFYDLNHKKIDAPKFNTEQYIFGACDAAVLYRRKALEEIRQKDEYFDEDFFGLVEDVDISWRLKKKGWRSLYLPKAIGIHQRGLSRKRNNFTQYLNLRNRYLMMLKNETLVGFLRFPLVFLVYDLWRNLFMLATNPGYSLKAYYEIFTWLPKMLGKRKYSNERL
jgi:GT2 family glycosyltransferase